MVGSAKWQKAWPWPPPQWGYGFAPLICTFGVGSCIEAAILVYLAHSNNIFGRNWIVALDHELFCVILAIVHFLSKNSNESLHIEYSRFEFTWVNWQSLRCVHLSTHFQCANKKEMTRDN